MRGYRRFWLAGRRRRPTPPAAGLRDLSDRDLELRWQVSTVRLRHPGTAPPVRLRLVAERAALLDEMERRWPERIADLLGVDPERRGENGGL